MSDIEEKSFEEELENHLKLASDNDIHVDNEYKKVMNMTCIIDALHTKGLTIEELKNPLIVQECIKSNFSTDAKIISTIFDIIRG